MLVVVLVVVVVVIVVVASHLDKNEDEPVSKVETA